MKERDILLSLFVLLGVAIGFGVFLVFLDTAFRGKADTMWSIAGWVCLSYPIVGLFLIVRGRAVLAWYVFTIALAYCFWYQVSMYGTGFFTGSMYLVGQAHILAAVGLGWAWRKKSRLQELIEP